MNAPIKNKYVVVIDGYFTRDGQVLIPKQADMSHNELMDSESMCDDYEMDENWKDICHKDIFLGIYDWPEGNEDGLMSYIGKKHGYPKGILQAYKV